MGEADAMTPTTSYDDLVAIRDETMREIIDLDSTADVHKVQTDVRAAGLQARYWRAVSLIAMQDNDFQLARTSAVQSAKFSEQQVRASKALIADRLDELEKRYNDSVAAATGLRLVK